MATNNTDRAIATLQTTDATQTTAITYAHADGASIFHEATVIARDAAGNTKSWKMALASKRVSGGGTALVGSLQSLLTAQGDVALATALAIVTNSGNNVIVQVTGVAATTINWHVYLQSEVYIP